MAVDDEQLRLEIYRSFADTRHDKGYVMDLVTPWRLARGWYGLSGAF